MAKGEKQVEGGSVAGGGSGGDRSSNGAGRRSKPIAQLVAWTVGDYRKNIGVAFVHENHVINVILNALPLDGKLTLMPQREKESQEAKS